MKNHDINKYRFGVLIVIAAFAWWPSISLAATITASQRLAIVVNATRVTNKLPALKNSYTLNRVALIHGQDMIRRGYFSHRSPSGSTYLTWLAAGPAKFSNTGENLARNYKDSNGAAAAWMSSTQHQNNILSAKMTHLGTAVVSGLVNGEAVKLYIMIIGQVKL